MRYQGSVLLTAAALALLVRVDAQQLTSTVVTTATAGVATVTAAAGVADAGTGTTATGSDAAAGLDTADTRPGGSAGSMADTGSSATGASDAMSDTAAGSAVGDTTADLIGADGTSASMSGGMDAVGGMPLAGMEGGDGRLAEWGGKGDRGWWGKMAGGPGRPRARRDFSGTNIGAGHHGHGPRSEEAVDMADAEQLDRRGFPSGNRGAGRQGHGGQDWARSDEAESEYLERRGPQFQGANRQGSQGQGKKHLARGQPGQRGSQGGFNGGGRPQGQAPGKQRFARGQSSRGGQQGGFGGQQGSFGAGQQGHKNQVRDMKGWDRAQGRGQGESQGQKPPHHARRGTIAYSGPGLAAVMNGEVPSVNIDKDKRGMPDGMPGGMSEGMPGGNKDGARPAWGSHK